MPFCLECENTGLIGLTGSFDTGLSPIEGLCGFVESLASLSVCVGYLRELTGEFLTLGGRPGRAGGPGFLTTGSDADLETGFIGEAGMVVTVVVSSM